MQENRLDEQKLEKAIELNIEEDFKDFDDPNGDDGKQNPIKDAIGHWTDKQIAENPTANLRYLKQKLKSATARQDLEEIKELISKISEIEKKHFNNQPDLEKGRAR